MRSFAEFPVEKSTSSLRFVHLNYVFRKYLTTKRKNDGHELQNYFSGDWIVEFSLKYLNRPTMFIVFDNTDVILIR